MQKQVALESFYILKPDWKKTSIEAAKLYFVFKKGVIVRKSADCLIAQVATENKVLLVHNDTDFERNAAR
jgi:predicted nucleic acid-binding protein